MKILAPASTVLEAEELIESGAAELYCGLHPRAWEDQFGHAVWLNRRGSGTANIESMSVLRELTAKAHAKGVPVFLTLNLPFYPEKHHPQILRLVAQVTEDGGVDALIISDPGLIKLIKDRQPKVVIHVSSLAAVLNSQAVAFFRDLGAARIIFPRYLDLQDMGKIISEQPGLEYEAFALNDGCIFEEGYCNVSHAFGGAFCHNPWWSYTLHGDPKRAEKESFSKHLEDYQWWQWLAIKNCGGVPGPEGMPMGMCGLCALPDLQTLKINSLKIVGREASLAKKKTSVALLQKTLEMLQAGNAAETVRQKAKELHNSPDMCQTGYMCYYR